MNNDERLLSLDVLRGADMLMITGFAGIVTTFCTAMGWGNCLLTEQFEHIPWTGLRFYDTIFPLFLFLSGASWPFSYSKSLERGRSRRQIVRKILVRAFWLVVFGFTYSPFFEFAWDKVHWLTVLTHIGICWAAAALIFMFVGGIRNRLLIAGGILVGYWLLLLLTRAPDQAQLLASTDPELAKTVANYAWTGTDGFSFTGNIAGWVDRVLLPGRLYEPGHHADGVLAKFPGIVTAMLGMFAGELLRRRDLPGCKRTLLLIGMGLACLVACLAWIPWCPVVKKIWTPTFVLATGAYSFLMLAVFYWVIDVRGWRKWTFFFQVIGVNSLTIYLMRRFIAFGVTARFFLGGIAAALPGGWGAFLLAVGYVAAWWLVLLLLHRHRIYLRV